MVFIAALRGPPGGPLCSEMETAPPRCSQIIECAIDLVVCQGSDHSHTFMRSMMSFREVVIGFGLEKRLPGLFISQPQMMTSIDRKTVDVCDN